MHHNNGKITKKQPVINWHILEECNFGCKYCFAHWPDPDAKACVTEVWNNPKLTDKILAELACLPSLLPGEWAGRPRLNIAGGEPLLLWKQGELLRILNEAKRLGFALSIITNGFLLKDDIVRELAPRLQILGISMDSENSDTNRKIGRCGKGNDTQQVSPERVAAIFRLAREVNPNIECKLNTVVCAENHLEDFHSVIQEIKPKRWKVFQMLPIADTPDIRIKQRPLIVADELFEGFKARHSDVESMRPENNDEMTESYVMVDPFGRFYQNGPAEGIQRHIVSDPIHEIGAHKAWDQVRFNPVKFSKRYPGRGRCVIPVQAESVLPVSAL